MSELERYVSFMEDTDIKVIPKIGTNLIKIKSDISNFGTQGYSTVPFVIDLDTRAFDRDDDDTTYSPFYDCEELRDFVTGHRHSSITRQVIFDKIYEFTQLKKNQGVSLFQDDYQDDEFIALMEKIRENNSYNSQINYGDISNNSSLLPQRMSDAISFNMPYIDGVKRTEWLLSNKRIQILKYTGSNTEYAHLRNKIFVSCVTYHAKQDTINKHEKLQMPKTTHKEVWKFGDVIDINLDEPLITIIDTTDNFLTLLRTSFPANKVIRVVLTNNVKQDIVDKFENYATRMNGIILVQKVIGRHTRQEKTYKPKARFDIKFIVNDVKMNDVFA
jgi:hypothetical protein